MKKEDNWKEKGEKFEESVKTTNWELGDWLVYGQSNFQRKISSKVYDRANDITGVDKQTLKKLARVSKRIPKEDRIEGLSYEHHQAVATLTKEDQRKKWLNFLEDLDYTPTKKLLRLSISCYPDNPKMITIEDYNKRKKRVSKDNYIPHLNRLYSILRKTVPDMDEDQIKALKKDAEGFVELLERL